MSTHVIPGLTNTRHDLTPDCPCKPQVGVAYEADGALIPHAIVHRELVEMPAVTSLLQAVGAAGPGERAVRPATRTEEP